MNKLFGTGLTVLAFSAFFFLSTALIAKKEQVRHVVVFKFKPTATPAQIAQVTQELGALKSKIPGIISFEHGVNDSPEKKNLGFTHVYLITFENAAARDTYLPHPEHKKFGQLLGKLGIMEDVFVVDYAPEAK
ncbi:Dabb family protein [Adhaeribacter radiodurans]|uniref:Dabb family protein n=1 Tax=Adhaeribacter radiodurans TaxID=2745197 RepID=A0A7L7LFY6_9BACT|nr:Dabb family protein [Adhaeribacter radiodurans]QMU31309.1 Dabb family protein [Adhaeribacter radiodurans]